MMDGMRAFFDERAQGATERETVSPLWTELLSPLALKGMAVTVVGVGDGALALWLLERGARVTLVDISPMLMAQTRERIEQAGASAGVAGYLMEDARTLRRIRAQSQQLVLSPRRLLHYLDARGRCDALRAMRRIAAPGGAIWAFAASQVPERGLPLDAALLRLCAVQAQLAQSEICPVEGGLLLRACVP